MAVLYRKYRPQTFGQVVGQKNIVKTLQNQISQGKVAHAYLFTGGRGVGKTSIARILAKALNCKKNVNVNELPGGSVEDACGECEVCKAVEAGNFIDLIEVDAASNTGVDNVREIIEHIKFAPSVGKYKVFIIDEVHMLSKGAFNALLKTLEEPPRHVVFVLATTEIHKVPSTIISRTQKFDFKALSAEELKQNLKNIAQKESLAYAEEIFDLVCQNAGGSVRDSLSILDKISTLGGEAEISDVRALLGVTDSALLSELLILIAEGRSAELPEFFDKLLEMGTDFEIFNKDFLEFARKLLVSKLIKEEFLESKFAELEVNDLIFIIRLFLKSFKDIQISPSPDIPLLLASIEASMKKAAPVSHPPVVAKEIRKEQETAKVVEPEAQLEVRSPQLSVIDSSGSESLTVDEVLVFWPDVLEKIREINGPLGSMLKIATLSGAENGRIAIQVKYLFDQKTIEKNSNLILKTIKEVSGKNLGISAKLYAAKHEDSPALSINDALQVFGGEVIE
ncbi:MAG: DNA polymerase III subunit gamma/tau [Candidatus Doudnabacteria bacterium]|nr:DNA polymerase III subunit gamma/tau [Candidatus Doudnabacteria bacterium]